MKVRNMLPRDRRAASVAWGLAFALGIAWPLAARAEVPPVPADTGAGGAASGVVAPAAPVAPVAAVAPTPPAARKPTRFAIGASFGFLRRQDVGRKIESLFVPSLVGLAYFRVASRVYLRPGLRLGFLGLDQPPAASDARIEENGFVGRAEVGVLYDAWLVPSLTVGAGVEGRVIAFEASGIAQPSPLVDRNEALGQLYGQLGLGLPLFHGFMVIEPYARLLHVFGDDRANSELGFDVTFAL